MPELLEAVRSVLPDAEVYVFGSALRNGLTANSDVDVLVVSDRALGSRLHKLAVAIEEKLRTPLIFEIHLTTKEKLAWYKKHAKELIPAEEIVQEVAKGDAETRHSHTQLQGAVNCCSYRLAITLTLAELSTSLSP